MRIFRSISNEQVQHLIQPPAIAMEASPIAFAGICDMEEKTLTLFLLTNEVIVVPFSCFTAEGDGTKPTFKKFYIDDWGHSIRFGRYEAGTDTIVMEARLRSAKASMKTNWEKKFDLLVKEPPKKRRNRK